MATTVTAGCCCITLLMSVASLVLLLLPLQAHGAEQVAPVTYCEPESEQSLSMPVKQITLDSEYDSAVLAPFNKSIGIKISFSDALRDTNPVVEGTYLTMEIIPVVGPKPQLNYPLNSFLWSNESVSYEYAMQAPDGFDGTELVVDHRIVLASWGAQLFCISYLISYE